MEFVQPRSLAEAIEAKAERPAAGPLFLNTRVVTAGSGIPGHNAPEPAD